MSVALHRWLESVGLGRLHPLLQAAGIDLDLLSSLAPADLAELGLTLGDRIRLREAIASRSAPVPAEAPGPGDPLPPAAARSRLLAAPACWPTPLARPVHEFLVEPDPVLALWAACDATEMALRFTVFVRVAELGAAGALPAELAGWIGPRLAEPTLGKWKEVAVRLTEPDLPATAVPALPALVRDRLVPLLAGAGRDPRSSLWELRNRLAHGGGLTRAAARALLDTWRPRLEDAWSSFDWPAEVKLVGPAGAGCRVLAGPGGDGLSWSGAPAADPAAPPGGPPRAGMALAFGDRRLPLFPFALFSRPEEATGPEPVQQLYVRRDDAALQYTALGSDEVWITRSDGWALHEYLRLFPARGPGGGRKLAVRGFEAEFRREADRLVGREAECRKVEEAIREAASGVLWLWGRAGSGKSMVVSRVACDLLDAGDPGLLVLAYRFREGDDRCSRGRWLEFCLERLFEWTQLDAAREGLGERDPVRQLAALRKTLAALPADRRVVLLLDGLDELAASDPRFAAEVPMALGRRLNGDPSGARADEDASRGGVVFLCAGRPEPELMQAFGPGPGCLPIWPHGLPPLDEEAVRLMLLEKIGPLRRRLLAQDRDRGDGVENAFVHKVAAAAEGLPIFVTYVIGDILGGRYRAMDAGERIPPTLDAYHAELLRRLGVGAVAQTATPLAALLALAREPLSEATLRELFIRGRVLPEDRESDEVVRRSLAALSNMVRRAPTPDGATGFALFHQSLRQHMLASPELRLPLLLARGLLAEATLDSTRLDSRPGRADAARPGGDAAGYLFRQGIAHLLEGGRTAEARQVLTDLDYLVARLECLSSGRPEQARPAVRAIGVDYRVAARGAEAEPEFDAFRRFWARTSPRLERLAASWPPVRLLVAAALQEPEDSPVARAAARHAGSGPRLSVVATAPAREREQEPCFRVLEAHPTQVRAVALARMPGAGGEAGASRQVLGPGARLLSGSSWGDCPATLLLWTGEDDFDTPGTLPCEQPDVVAVAFDATATRAIACGEGWLGAWDVVTRRHLGTVACEGLLCLASAPWGEVATGHRDGTFRRWRIGPGGLEPADRTAGPAPVSEPTELRNPTLPVRAVVPDPTGSGFCRAVGSDVLLADGSRLGGHRGDVVVVCVSEDGRTLAAGTESGEVGLWDLGIRRRVATWDLGPDAVGALALAPDGGKVYAGLTNGPADFDVRDRTLRVLDPATGRCEKRLVGQVDRVYALALAPETGVLVSAGADRCIRFWDLDLPADRLPAPIELEAVGSVRSLDGGRRVVTASDDQTVRVWDARTLRCEELHRGHEHVVWTAVPHPFAPLLYSVSEDGTLRSWRRDGTPLARVAFPGERLFGLAVSPDGSRLAASVGERERGEPRIVVWDLANGGTPDTLVGPEERIPSLVFSPCGRYLAAPSWDRHAHVFDLRDGRQVMRLPVSPGGESAVGACFHPSGRWLVVSEEYGGTIRSWDLADGSLRELRGHLDQVRRLAFAPDGELLWSAGDDETVRAWAFSTGTCLDVLPLDSWATDVAVLSAGASAVVGAMNGLLAHVVLEGRSPGAAPVRPVRPWRPGPDDHGLGRAGAWGEPVVVCPGCGSDTPARRAAACPSCGLPWAWMDQPGVPSILSGPLA